VELDLNTMTWAMLNPTGTLPLARSAYSAVYDPDNHQIIVFSGAASPITNDLWALDLTYGSENWQQLSPGGNIPEGRAQPFCVYDHVNNRMITGFGFDYPGYIQLLSDVWSLDLDSLFWRRIIVPGLVDARRGTGGSLNSLNNEIIVFGGDNMGFSYAESFSITSDTLAIEENRNRIRTEPSLLKIFATPTRLPCKMNINIITPSFVNLKIIDISGRLIRELIEGERNIGTYQIQWDGKDMQGRKVPAGTYFVHLEIDGKSVTQKAIIIE